MEQTVPLTIRRAVAAVPLRSGDRIRWAWIDARDWPLVEPHRWRLHPTGYAMATVRPAGRDSATPILLHRVVAQAPAGRQVDHVSGDKLNCRRANLRLVDHSGNGQNQKARARTTSGLRGVYPTKAGRWKAEVTHRGRRHYLGVFDRPEDAYDAARAKRSELGFLRGHTEGQP